MSRAVSRRTEILLRAAQSFVRHGYAATSMSELAERCRMTKPGLYYHFRSKQELLFAIMSQALDVLERTTLDAALTASSHEVRLRRILRAHALLITRAEHSPVTILVAEEREALRPDDRRIIDHRLRTYLELIRATLEGIREQGRLRDVDTGIAALGLVGMVISMARWYRSTGRLTANQVAEQITDLAVASVLLGEGRTGSATRSSTKQ